MNCKHDWDLLNCQVGAYKNTYVFYCRKCLDFKIKERVTDSKGMQNE